MGVRCRESEEDYNHYNEQQTIEYFVASCERQRASSRYHIPMPWPFSQSSSSEVTQEIVEEATAAINTILKGWGIVPTRITSVLLKPQGAYDRRQTLLIDTSNVVVDMKDPSWKDAATDIQQIIDNAIQDRRLKNMEISVEIRNPELMNSFFSSAIIYDSPAHRFFSSIEHRVTKLVREHCPAAACISYVMRGRRHETKDLTPTIMVTIEEGALANWNLSFRTISKTLDELKTPKSPNFTLEFSSGHVSPAVDKGNAVSSVANGGSGDMSELRGYLIEDVPEYPDVGDSISPYQIEADGTLGLWVWFQPKGNSERIACFLCCYHTIRKGEQNKKKQRVNDAQGINIRNSTPRPPIVVYSPGFLDMTTTLREYKARVAEINRKYSDVSNRLMPAAIAEDQETSKKVIDFINKAKNGDGLGSVIFASGNRNHNKNGRLMDWALVKMHDQSLIRKNKVVLRKELPTYLRPTIKNYLNATSFVEKIGDPSKLVKEQVLFKRGKNGVTTGEFSAMRSTISVPGKPTSIEITAMPLAGGRELALAQNGDSGSMVHNDAGEWIGMITGVVTGGETFFTGAPELVAAIKEATGGDIYLP